MISVIGINHRSAPVEVREKFSLSENECIELSNDILAEQDFKEIVILPTCNRFEIYYYTNKKCTRSHSKVILNKVLEFKNIDLENAKHFYTYEKIDAVEHLFTVSSGLNSMVLGENQILGQVKEAYRLSADNKFTKTIFNRLFHRAFEVGKKVRTETGINKGATSLSYAAVELAGKIFANIKEKSVLLIGAGETAELVLNSLYERGISNIYISNRTRSNAESIAQKYSGKVVPFEEIQNSCHECDIIISAVSVSDPIITREKIDKINRIRKNPTLLFIDLSVPRSIDPVLKEYETIFLYDVDDLEKVVQHNYENRKNEIEIAEQIVKNYVHDFEEWFNSLEIVPIIQILKKVLSEIREEEVNSNKNKLNDLEFEKTKYFASSLTNRIQSMFIKNLKTISQGDNGKDVFDTIIRLFKTENREVKENE